MEGKVRLTCQKCGFVEVRDQQGRQLLTDNVSGQGQAQPSAQYLTEG
jgi:hypothetical protein